MLVWILLAVLIIIIIIMRYKPDVHGDSIRTLVRQGARWSTAAEQDNNPMIAVLHANYGAGYLWALADIATPAEIEKHSGIDYKKYKNAIVKIQDKTTKRMASVCPAYAPNPTYLTAIGGEGV